MGEPTPDLSKHDAVAAYPDDLRRLTVRQPFRLNNVALKWIRDTHESPAGNPITDCVDLTERDPLEIGQIEKISGMDYSFRPGVTTPWSWRQMLASLPMQTWDIVIGVPAQGVSRVTCEPVPRSYDHKRCHAARHLKRPFGDDIAVPVWDFFVTRADGSRVRFHTNYGDKKVSVAQVREDAGLSNVPARGKGRSEGRGSYRRQEKGNYDVIVRPGQGANDGGNGSAVAETPASASAMRRTEEDGSAVAEPRDGQSAPASTPVQVTRPPGLEGEDAAPGQSSWAQGQRGGDGNSNGQQMYGDWNGYKQQGGGDRITHNRQETDDKWNGNRQGRREDRWEPQQWHRNERWEAQGDNGRAWW